MNNELMIDMLLDCVDQLLHDNKRSRTFFLLMVADKLMRTHMLVQEEIEHLLEGEKNDLTQ